MHDAEPGADIRTFLDSDPRQVWALHRETGDPFYLAEGQADAQRPFTKAHLRCPHPDCTVPISTRGSDRVRDHYFHLSGTPHETGPESEAHLAGKAMLVAWARTRIPGGATVAEEKSIKDPETRRLRRPDVLVTGGSGSRVAFEVEYKDWSVETGWRPKQVDLDRQQIPTLWLIGHTKVKPYSGYGANAVRLPWLAVAMVRAKKPVLLINPSTRQVGTLADDSEITQPFTGRDVVAWLHLDLLEECAFHRIVGIVTPAMQRIAAAEAGRARHRAEEAERDLRREQARAEQRRKDAEAIEASRQRRERYEAAQAAAWEASPLRQTVLDRWGAVPALFRIKRNGQSAIYAVPEHWHAALYEDLVGGRTEDFHWRDLFAVLDRHRIGRRSATGPVYRALEGWLEDLAGLGLVKIHRDSGKRILMLSPTGLTLDQAIAAQAVASARRGQTAHGARRFTAAWQRPSFSAAIADRAGQDDGRRTRLVVFDDGTRRWIPKGAPTPPGAQPG